MKHFIYTYHEKWKSGATIKTVRIYRLKRGIPSLVASLSETFVSEFQLVMLALRANKLLPAKAFEKNQFGGFKYGHSSELEAQGIASVRCVS